MGDKPYKRIAVEEGFNIPEVGLRARPAGQAAPDPSVAAAFKDLSERLNDIGAGRVKAMDEANIDMQLLMINSPGVQHLEPARAVDMAMLVNDRAAEACAKFPGRFAALAAIATPDPAAAAKELDRAVNKLGLKGGIINSHTNSEYLDNQKYWPILEAAEALDVPIYLHPREPSAGIAQATDFIPQFMAGWNYAVETGTHCLRMMVGGVFDRFPKIKFVIGHMGEAIPFFLPRMDNRYLNSLRMRPAGKMQRLPSEYFLSNFHITTSGMNYAPQLLMSIQVVGVDRILFAADWPFEKQKEDGTDAMDAISLSPDDKKKIYQTNAERVFKL